MSNYVYRGFRIKIVEDGDQFRPYWCESIKDEWVGGQRENSQSTALCQAKKKIDRQYLIESEQLTEA